MSLFESIIGTIAPLPDPEAAGTPPEGAAHEGTAREGAAQEEVAQESAPTPPQPPSSVAPVDPAEDLRSTARRFSALLDHLPDVILYETGGGREYISPNIEVLLGYSADELTKVRGTFPSLIHPDDSEKLAERLLAWRDEGRPGTFTAQFRVRKRSGDYIWLEDRIIGVQNENGRSGMIGVMVDITERYRAQERYQAIVEAADVAGLGLCIIHARELEGSYQPMITYFNQAVLDMCGRTYEEVLGRNIKDFVPEHEWAGIDERWRQYLRGELERNFFEMELQHKLGHPIYVSVGLTRKILDGKAATVAFLTDITERKFADEQLRSAKDAAEEISHIKSNILSNFSHELRTPLHSILGFSGILAEETGEKDLREYAKSIKRSGQRLLSTVTSIVELAALESPSRDRVLYPAAVHEIVRDEALSYQPTIEEHGLRFELDLQAQDLIVFLDKDRFHKAFEKIIANAIKFTHAGFVRIEVVEIAKELLPPEVIQSQREACAAVRISDSGVGMSQEFIEKAFDKFKQESTGMARRYEGTGLGLPLARSYIRIMNGDVSITSTPGVGTTVSVLLPIVAKMKEGA